MGSHKGKTHAGSTITATRANIKRRRGGLGHPYGRHRGLGRPTKQPEEVDPAVRPHPPPAPGDKKLARTYALVSLGTHERARLLSVKRMVEKTYGFTQNLEMRVTKPLPREQRTMAEYIRR